jgi:hypothetical protein
MESVCAVLYCHLWPVWLYHIFPHSFINDMILGKKVIEHEKCVLIFSKTFVGNLSRFKKNSARYYHKNVDLYVKYPQFFQILMKFESSLI